MSNNGCAGLIAYIHDNNLALLCLASGLFAVNISAKLPYTDKYTWVTYFCSV